MLCKYCGSSKVHYNFVKLHQSLNGKTPAQASGLTIKNDWHVLVKEATKYEAVHKKEKYKSTEVVIA